MMILGTVTGLAIGMTLVRHIESLLFCVKATDSEILALPSLAIIALAFEKMVCAIFLA